MIVYTDKDIYECASAVQYADGVHLLEENGEIFLVIAQPDRIQKIEGGEVVVKVFPVANRNVMAGEYITVGGVLYKATANIPNGGNIITGQNAVVTTVEEQLYELTKGE